MTFLTLVVIVTTLATFAALVLGISSMVCDHEIAHFDSEHWMASRVFLQVVVVLTLLAAFFVGT